MIREYIKKQLAQCHFADLSNYDAETNTFKIKKYSKPTYDINHCYLIQLFPSLLDPSSVVAVNWNSGALPPGPFLKAFVSKTLGNMIYVDSIVYDITTNTDTNQYWSGWLPIDELSQLAAF